MSYTSHVSNKGILYTQRIGYGLGDFACNLIWEVISLYLLYFYTDVMALDPLAIAAMFVTCRVIDGVTDLLVGYAIDKSRTRWGKSRPWFLFGSVPFAVAAFLAFTVPDISPNGKLVYAYITYIFLSFMYTVVNIPLASILPALTDGMNERTVLATSACPPPSPCGRTDWDSLRDRLASCPARSPSYSSGFPAGWQYQQEYRPYSLFQHAEPALRHWRHRLCSLRELPHAAGRTDRGWLCIRCRPANKFDRDLARRAG